MLVCDCLFDVVILGSYYCNLTPKTGGFNLALVGLISSSHACITSELTIQVPQYPFPWMQTPLLDSKLFFQLDVTIQIQSLVSTVEASFLEYKLRLQNPSFERVITIQIGSVIFRINASFLELKLRFWNQRFFSRIKVSRIEASLQQSKFLLRNRNFVSSLLSCLKNRRSVSRIFSGIEPSFPESKILFQN